MLRRAVLAARATGQQVGLVPTMGALHEGHLSLVDQSCSENDLTIVTVFVNPTQFGPGEDFQKYPRDLVSDVAKVAHRGCGLVFAPSTETMYPPGHATHVDVGELVREVVQQARRQGMNIDCQIEESLPAMPGNEGDVWRLAWLLIQAAHSAGPPVTVRVSLQERKLVLCVEDSGPGVEADQLDDVLEPFGSARAGPKVLERAAWLTICRRLKAKLPQKAQARIACTW